MIQPCARRAHRHPPTEQHSTIVGRIYPIQMYTPQTNNTPQLLAEHIQYKYISQNMYMPQPCARRAHRQPQTEQHSTTVGRIYPVKCTPPKRTTPQNCWQNISNTNIYLKTCKCPNLLPEGHTDSSQLNITLQLLAEYIQYKCTTL